MSICGFIACCFVVCVSLVIRSRLCSYKTFIGFNSMSVGIHLVWEFSCVVHWDFKFYVHFMAPHLSFLKVVLNSMVCVRGMPSEGV